MNTLNDKIDKFLTNRDAKSYGELYEPLKLWAKNVMYRYKIPYDEISLCHAFETVYFKIDIFDIERGDFKNWFFTIYKNDLFYRRRKCKPIFVANYYDESLTYYESYDEESIELVQKEINQLLKEAVNYVNQRNKNGKLNKDLSFKLIDDIIVNELEYEEVSKKYNINVSTVKSFIFYVRNYIMNKALKGNYSDTVKGYAYNRKRGVRAHFY